LSDSEFKWDPINYNKCLDYIRVEGNKRLVTIRMLALASLYLLNLRSSLNFIIFIVCIRVLSPCAPQTEAATLLDTIGIRYYLIEVDVKTVVEGQG